MMRWSLDFILILVAYGSTSPMSDYPLSYKHGFDLRDQCNTLGRFYPMILCRLFLSNNLQLTQYHSSKHYRAQHSILTCCHREWSSLQDEAFSHQTTHGQEVQPEVSLLQTDSDEGISLQGTHISSPGAPFLRATLASSRKVRGR